MTGTLVLLRHGQSTANADGTFTGLLDVPLTAVGEAQATEAGKTLRGAGVRPDLVLTSTLQRAAHTVDLVTDALGIDVLVEQVWQLGERNYGALTGMTKSRARREYGDAQFQCVRRSLHGRPPAMPWSLWFSLRMSAAFRGAPLRAVGRTESLSDVVTRIRPVLDARIMPAVLQGRTVLVVAHGNSLRALCLLLDSLTEPEVETLNLPTGQPLLYRVEDDGSFMPRGGTYLNSSAKDAAARVAAEGGT